MAKPAVPNAGLGERLVRNLRDLQLDDELDYPDIDSASFDAKDSVQNQQQRIRKAEWLFYNLLQLWNPNSAKKLGEFYPAYEPKQSLDLRGAIFQQLSALRREGVFPKELILRKTMLDECKGPKFEELLVALSTSVLLKVMDKNTSDRSALKRMLLSEKPVDLSELQALGTAYRYSLSHDLANRRDLRRRWLRFGRVLKVKQEEIKQRRREHEIKAEEVQKPRIPRRRLDRLNAHIERDWMASSEWRSILTRGDQHLSDKSLLERPYSEVWHHASEDTLYHFRPEKTRSALQRLEYHVEKQNQRLAKWRDAKKVLEQVVSTPTAESHTSDGAGADQRSGSPELGSTAYEQTDSGHRRRESKRRVATPPSPPPTTSPKQRRQDSERRSAKDRSLLDVTRSELGKLDLRGIEAPELERTLSASKKRSETLTPASEKQYRRRSNTVIYSPHPSLRSKSSMDQLDEEGYESPAGYFDDSLELDQDATDIIKSVLQAEPSPAKRSQHLSLTERARLTMAAHGGGGGGGSQVQTRARSTSPVKQDALYDQQQTGRPISTALEDRTRQSLSFLTASMMPPPPPLPHNQSPQESSSRPGTARRANFSVNSNTSQRGSRSPEKRNRLPRPETPELSHIDESFLAETIDEDTIFMSRPKIALSPPLYPVSSREEDRGEQDMPGMDIRDDMSVEDFS